MFGARLRKILERDWLYIVSHHKFSYLYEWNLQVPEVQKWLYSMQKWVIAIEYLVEVA